MQNWALEGAQRAACVLPPLLTVPPASQGCVASLPLSEPANGSVLQWDHGLGVERLLDLWSLIVEGPDPPFRERQRDSSGCPSPGVSCVVRPEPASREQSGESRESWSWCGCSIPPFLPDWGSQPSSVSRGSQPGWRGPAGARRRAAGADRPWALVTAGRSGGTHKKFGSLWVEIKPCAPGLYLSPW